MDKYSFKIHEASTTGSDLVVMMSLLIGTTTKLPAENNRYYSCFACYHKGKNEDEFILYSTTAVESFFQKSTEHILNHQPFGATYYSAMHGALSNLKLGLDAIILNTGAILNIHPQIAGLDYHDSFNELGGHIIDLCNSNGESKGIMFIEPADITTALTGAVDNNVGLGNDIYYNIIEILRNTCPQCIVCGIRYETGIPPYEIVLNHLRACVASRCEASRG